MEWRALREACSPGGCVRNVDTWHKNLLRTYGEMEMEFA